MKTIIQAELYKLVRRKQFVALTLLSLWSLVYGLGAAFHWEFVQIGARLDLVTFTTTMWTFLIVLTIPLLLMLHISSAILGGEIREGQILLEVNRVSSRKVLLLSKYLVTLISIVFLYLVNMIASFMSYAFFISQSSYGYSHILTTHSTNLQSIVVSLLSLGFLILLASLTFYLSLHYSPMVATLMGVGGYLLCQLLAYIKVISPLVPGYFFVVPDYHFSFSLAGLHLIEYLVICVLLLWFASRRFEKQSF